MHIDLEGNLWVCLLTPRQTGMSSHYGPWLSHGSHSRMGPNFGLADAKERQYALISPYCIFALYRGRTRQLGNLHHTPWPMWWKYAAAGPFYLLVFDDKWCCNIQCQHSAVCLDCTMSLFQAVFLLGQDAGAQLMTWALVDQDGLQYQQTTVPA